MTRTIGTAIARFFRNVSIAHKLTLGFGIPVLLMFLGTGASYINSRQTTLMINTTNDVLTPAALTASSAQADLLTMLSDVRGYLALGDPEYREHYQQSAQAFEARLADLDALASNLDPEDRRRLRELRTAYEEWSGFPERLFQLRDDRLDREPAYHILVTDGARFAGEVLIDINLMIEIQGQREPTEENLARLQDMAKFQGNFANMLSALRGYVTTRNRVFRGEYEFNLTDNQNVWDRLSGKRTQLTPNQQQLVDRIAQNRDAFLLLPEQMFEILESDQWREDLYLFKTEAVPLAEDMQQLLGTITKDQQALLTGKLDSGSRGLANVGWLNLVGSAITLISGVGLVSAVHASIVGPVRRLTTVARAISDGDLGVQARVESSDEIGILAETFNNMTTQLRQTLAQLEQRVHELQSVHASLEARTTELSQTNEELEQEITERKQAEEELRVKNSAIASSINAIVIAEFAGNLTYVNASFLKMWGYDDENQVLGRPAVEFWQTEKRARDVVEALRDGRSWIGELAAKRRDGSSFDVQASASAVSDEAGKPICMMASFEDITERKQAEEALRESEARYRAVVEDQTELICRFLPGGTITFVNEAYCRYFDKERQAVRGHSFIPLIPDQDQAQTRELVASLAPERPVATHKQRVIRPDGTIGWLQWTNRAIFDALGRLIEIQAVGRDITERKRTEQLLQTLNQAALAMGKALRPEEVFAAVVKELGRIGFSCRILPLDKSRSMMFTSYVSYEAQALKAAEQLAGLRHDEFSFPIAVVDLFRTVIEERRTTLSLDAQEVIRQMLPDRLKELAGQLASILDMSRAIVAPLIVEDDVLGVLSVQSDDLAESDIPAITAFAHQVTAAWHKAQLYDQAQREIAERKRAEEALRESQRRFAAFMAHLPGIALMKDAEGRYLYLNETLKEMYRLRVERWQGKTDDDVWPTDVAHRLKANDRLVMTEGTSLEMIEEVPQEDGVHHWLMIKFPVRGASGQPGILGGIGVDITERIQIEEELRRYREHLEELVTERTAELVRANEQLRQEITERKQADEALRESELKFRSFIEQSLDGICLTDEGGTIIEWNQGLERIAGLKQDEALGRPLWDVLSQLSVAERTTPAVDEAHKDSIFTILDTGRTPWSERLRELDVQRPDGEHRTIQQVTFPIRTEEGFLVGSTTRDITERKQVELEIQRHARELTALNRAGRIIASSLDLNEVLTQIMAETRAMLDAEGASVLLHDADSDELVFTATAGLHSKALTGARMPASLGIVGRVWRGAQPMLIRDAQSDPGFYGGIDDITLMTTRSMLAVPLEYRGAVIGVLVAVNKADRPFDEHDLGLLDTIAASAASAIANARLYEAEREQRELVERSQTQLINAEKMAALGRLAASIAHEINNPMQSVVGCLALAQQELGKGNDVEEYIQVSLGEVRRVARTVGLMRDLYRPTSGKRELADVNELVEQVLTLTRKRCQQGQVTVLWGPAPSLPTLSLSRDQITQVFLNLVLNALDAMPGGGTLEVSTAISTAPDGEPTGVEVRFSDTGMGISDDTLSMVFEPFRSTKPDGTGLGLSISYGIVEQHGGTIVVESAAGEGSTFTVQLPE